MTEKPRDFQNDLAILSANWKWYREKGYPESANRALIDIDALLDEILYERAIAEAREVFR